MAARLEIWECCYAKICLSITEGTWRVRGRQVVMLQAQSFPRLREWDVNLGPGRPKRLLTGTVAGESIECRPRHCGSFRVKFVPGRARPSPTSLQFATYLPFLLCPSSFFHDRQPLYTRGLTQQWRCYNCDCLSTTRSNKVRICTKYVSYVGLLFTNRVTSCL